MAANNPTDVSEGEFAELVTLVGADFGLNVWPWPGKWVVSTTVPGFSDAETGDFIPLTAVIRARRVATGTR